MYRMNNSIFPTLPYLGIRFSHSDISQCEQFKTFLISYAVPLIIVLEDADEEVNRSHTHSLIQTPITINTFRKQLKKNFPDINGNKDFSITQVNDPAAMLRYVAKGKKDTSPQILFSNFTPELVAKSHLEYWTQNSQLKKSTVKKTQKTHTWSEKVLEELKALSIPEGGWSNRLECVDVVFKHVLKCLGKTAKKLNVSIIRDLVNGFMNALIIGKNRSDYEQQLFVACYPEGSDYVREYWRS